MLRWAIGECKVEADVKHSSIQSFWQLRSASKFQRWTSIRFSSKHAMMSKETSEMKYLHMLRRQWDPNGTHNFLRKGLLTTRPTKNISHNIITIILFPICGMKKVILRLFCLCIMWLRCWNSFNHLLSRKREFIPADNNSKDQKIQTITKKLPHVL